MLQVIILHTQNISLYLQNTLLLIYEWFSPLAIQTIGLILTFIITLAIVTSEFTKMFPAYFEYGNMNKLKDANPEVYNKFDNYLEGINER